MNAADERPVVDLRAIPYERIHEPLDAILWHGEESSEYAFPWIFDDNPPHSKRAGA